MDPYGLNDEPDDFCSDVFQPISDVLQLQLPDQSPSFAAAMLGDNLGTIPLPCGPEELSLDSIMTSSGDNNWDADLDLLDGEGSRLLLNKPCNEICPPAAALDCKVCGKVFSTASSLSKHHVTHSQERRHVCEICKKGFKRQDHLMGHMLTHLKVKPFVCRELGCDKSYCDSRSLRRHHEVHHGLWTQQQNQSTANLNLAPGTVPVPISVPLVVPSNDIRCLVTEIVQQKVTPIMAVLQERKDDPVSQTTTVNKEDSAPVTSYTAINSTMQPNYVRYSDLSPGNSLNNVPLLHYVQDQTCSYASGSFAEAALSGGCLETYAGCPNSLDHRYTSPPEHSGQETVQAQHSFTQEPEFTRLTIQNPDGRFQDPANFYPLVTSFQTGISHSTSLSLPSMPVPQWLPGTTGMGDPHRDPQGLPVFFRILGDTGILTNGSQSGPTREAATSASGGESSNQETWPKRGRCQRKSAIVKDKVWPHLSSTVPASQVALESFSDSSNFQANKRMYRLTLSNQGEWDKRSRQHQAEAAAQAPVSGATEDAATGPLVIPVSVPVKKKENRVNGITSPLQKHTTKKGKKMRPCPKPLYIPPPVLEKNSSSSGSFQSGMRSPDTPLSDHLHHSTFTCQYTPPPMLSPIRQGTGLYFSTFCTSSETKYQPPSLEEKDPGGIRLMKDSTEISVQPHINIGDRFQAVIPERAGHSLLEGGEEKADLVWRPCLQPKELSHFLNLACSSAVPGGGCNLELGLHCLHFSQGNVLEALEKLLGKEPQTLLPRCLADYHYAGSDHWSVSEKGHFKKANNKQWKNFSYIQSKIPGKSVYQCVEYYYTWKKVINLERPQNPNLEQGPSAQNGEEPLGRPEPHIGVKGKVKGQEKNKEKSPCSQKETRDGEQPSVKFACQECDRIFDKIKSRNAHMKKHRLQEDHARILSLLLK